MTYPPHSHDGPTNPLSRLLTVLRHVRDSARPFGDDDPGPADHVWIKALDLEDFQQLDSEITLLLSDLERFRLLTKASHPPDLDVYLRPISAARSALLSVRGATWAEYCSMMTEPFIDSLALLSSFANAYAAEFTLSDEEAVEFRSRIAQLLQDISTSSLPSQLKQEILAGLFSLHEALTDHQVHGSYALRDALDRNIGIALRQQPAIQTIEPTYQKRCLQPWSTLVSDLFKCLGSTLNRPELADAAIQGLLHLTSGQ